MANDHAVLVFITATSSDIDLDTIEDSLTSSVTQAEAGEFDGDEIGPTGVTLFLYGSDADRLYGVVSSTLRHLGVVAGTKVTRRYGGPGATEVATELDTGEETTVSPRQGGRSSAEGDWVAVPLPDSGWALGLVARSNEDEQLLGYFFGPRLRERPSLDDVHEHNAQDAIYVTRCSDSGIVDGRWHVLGALEAWNREDWPVPEFGFRYRNEAPERRRYDDALRWVSAERMTVEEYLHLGLPDDRLSGSGAVEIRLAKLL